MSGGGFGVNVHNTLEPSVYSIPVLFGPNHHNSPEAEELIAIQAATEIHDSESLVYSLKRLIEDPDTRETQGSIARRYVNEHVGAAQTIAEKITSSINSVNS